MGARRVHADARIGWLFAVVSIIAVIATPSGALAMEPVVSGDARILYFEALHSLAPQSGGDAGQQKPGAGEQQLGFDAYGRRFELSLNSNDRLNGLVRQKTTGSSLRLYQGSIEGNAQSWVRLAVDRDEIHGMMWDGADLYVIEPAADVLDALVPPLAADPSDTLIFRLADVLVPADASGFADDSVKVETGAKSYASLLDELKGAPTALQATGATRRITLAALADSKFLQRYTSEQAARDALLTRLNNVDGIFSSQLGIEIHVDGLFVTDAANDSFSGTTSANGLLTEVGKLRKRTPALSSRGITHLFTGRDLDGTTIGIAYLDSVCHTEYSAGLTEAQSSWRDSLVAAHEIGHNFGADHDGDPAGSCSDTPSSGYLMGATVSGSDTFSQCSLNRIRVRAQTASCLTSLPPANMAVSGDLGTKRYAVATEFEWQLDVSNIGGRSARNVRVELLVPPVVRIDDAYVTGGTCTSGAGVIQCQLGDVPGSAARIVHLRLQSEVVGSNSISARVTSDNDASQGDDEGDGTLVIQPEVDLGVTLQGPASVQPSETFNLALSVVNQAAVGATDVEVTVELPNGIVAMNPSLGGVGCTNEQVRIRCALPSLAPGATVTGTLSANASTMTTGDMLLRASVSGGYVDPDASNDRSDLAVSVTSIAKPATQTSGASGGGGGGSMGLLFLLGLASLGLRRRL